MSLLWVLSVYIKNVSIVDIFWGLGFVIVNGVYFLLSEGYYSRNVILLFLVSIWGLRLSIYLAYRNIGKGEDFRYQEFRRHYGVNRYWWVSFFQVFLLQGVLILLVALPLLGVHFYTEKNEELALAFANQAAVAIENARLYQRSLRYAEDLEVRVNERTRDLSTLYEITAVASTYPELEKILDGSLEILLDTLGCLSGVICIKGDDGHFELKSHKGVPEAIVPIISVFEYEDGFIKQVVDDPNHPPIACMVKSPAKDLAPAPGSLGLSTCLSSLIVMEVNTGSGNSN